MNPGPESTDAASSDHVSEQDVVSEDTEEPKAIETSMDNLRICIFCNHKSEGIKKNLDHMRKHHSFIVLDIDCLISLKALLYYISEKVHIAKSCLFCHKMFKDGRSVQLHMIDKGHTMMSSEDFDEEYEPFYDFSGTYEEQFVGKTLEDFDLSEEVAAKPHPNLTMAPKPIEESNKEDDDWEDIDAEDD